MSGFPRGKRVAVRRASIVAVLSASSLVVAHPAVHAAAVPQSVSVQQHNSILNTVQHNVALGGSAPSSAIVATPKVDVPQNNDFFSNLLSGKIFGFDLFGIFRPIINIFKGLFSPGGGTEPNPVVTPTPDPAVTMPVIPQPGQPGAGDPGTTQPVDPGAGAPEGTQPAQPAQPQPTVPVTEPVQPQPEQPKPVQPKPEQPKPVQPQPVQPKPAQPETRPLPGGGFGGGAKKPIEIVLKSLGGQYTPDRFTVPEGQPVTLVVDPGQFGAGARMLVAESGQQVDVTAGQKVSLDLGVVPASGFKVTAPDGTTLTTIMPQSP